MRRAEADTSEAYRDPREARGPIPAPVLPVTRHGGCTRAAALVGAEARSSASASPQLRRLLPARARRAPLPPRFPKRPGPSTAGASAPPSVGPSPWIWPDDPRARLPQQQD